MADTLREDILKTAAGLFFKYGLRSVSIEDICNELRISKKTFYTCFAQKEHLIDEIMIEFNEDFVKRMELKIKTLTHPEPTKVIDLVLFILAFHLVNSNTQFDNFFFDMQKYYPEAFVRHTERHQEMIVDYIGEMLLKGIEEGLYRQDIQVELTAQLIALQLKSLMDYSKDKLSKMEQKKNNDAGHRPAHAQYLQ